MTSMKPIGALASSATPLFKFSAAALEFSVSILLIYQQMRREGSK